MHSCIVSFILIAIQWLAILLLQRVALVSGATAAACLVPPPLHAVPSLVRSLAPSRPPGGAHVVLVRRKDSVRIPISNGAFKTSLLQAFHNTLRHARAVRAFRIASVV